MKVKTNNKIIDLVIAKKFHQKLLGFMFKKNINHAIRFKTNSIHTFFMKSNIDVIMTDKNNNVLYIFKNITKNKIIIKKNVYYTYEFPPNYIDNNLEKIEIL